MGSTPIYPHRWPGLILVKGLSLPNFTLSSPLITRTHVDYAQDDACLDGPRKAGTCDTIPFRYLAAPYPSLPEGSMWTLSGPRIINLVKEQLSLVFNKYKPYTYYEATKKKTFFVFLSIRWGSNPRLPD